jgi:hypothetical protein
MLRKDHSETLFLFPGLEFGESKIIMVQQQGMARRDVNAQAFCLGISVVTFR